MKSISIKLLFRPFRGLLATCGILVVSLSGCMHNPQVYKPHERYSAETMAKDWRENVRRNPNNPYEGYSYPADNDSDYYIPKPSKKEHSPSTRKANRNSTPYDDNDSYYGKFPKYNPDDDNIYMDPKNYPLYMDY